MPDYEIREKQLSLEFLKELIDLAVMAREIGSSKLDFDLGAVDGIIMNVEISFSYRREEASEDG